jgi:paired amphipathic helix protein Sin3a
MGTTVQSISGRQPLPESSSGAYYGRPPWQQQPQHSIESPGAVFSPQNQNGGPAYSQNQARSSYEAQQVHHQQQRGATALTNAALGNPPRNAQTPTPGAQDATQNGMEKRGPVEFNHAISYVNKIKVSCF